MTPGSFPEGVIYTFALTYCACGQGIRDDEPSGGSLSNLSSLQSYIPCSYGFFQSIFYEASKGRKISFLKPVHSLSTY